MIAVTMPFPHYVWAGTTMTLIQLAKETDIRVDYHNQDLSRTRARALASFLASDNDKLLFLDADIHLTPTDVRLLDQANDFIVGAPYPKKQILFPAGATSPVYVPSWNPDPHAPPPEKTGGLLAVRHLPMGATMISRECAQRVSDAEPDRFIDEFSDHDGRSVRRSTPNVFGLILREPEPEANFAAGERHLYPEDYSFCARAKAVGIQAWLHTGTAARHAGVIAVPL